MNDLRGAPSVHTFAAVANSNGPVQVPQAAAGRTGRPRDHAPSNGADTARRTVVMTKGNGERSFGMTLEQDREIGSSDYPRVAYVFPNSAASRAGVSAGWTIEFIHGASCRGRAVRDVAMLFRNVQEVAMSVDTRPEALKTPTLPTLAQPAAQACAIAGPVAPTQPPAQVYARATAPTNAATSPVASTASSSSVSTDANVSSTSSAAAGSAVSSVVLANTAVTTARVAVVPASAPSSIADTRQTEPSNPQVPSASVLPHQKPVMTNGSDTISNGSLSVLPVAATPAAVQARPTAPPATAPQPSGSTSPTPAPPPQTDEPLPAQSASTRAMAVPQTRPAATVPVSCAHAQKTLPSVASAAAASASPAVQSQPRSSGKKRARPASSERVAEVAPVAPPTATGNRTQAGAREGKKRGRQTKRKSTTAIVDVDGWDSDDAVFFYGSDDEIEVVSNNGSRRSSRQAESGGRARRSLTVDRLMNMGFMQEDAELSVEACGQDPEKCMIWIVSHLEEKQFMNDLNKASIESENQKRLDAQEQMKQESETLRQATGFSSLFESSYILSTHADAPQLQAMLSTTIGEIAADTLVRTLITKLLTVESKAIKWYKEAAKCYMLELAARLEAAFASHDAVTCCSQLMAAESAASACSFVRALNEEEKELTKVLFHMPENHGGVPLAFLRADESMKFSLDDDGFEVIDPLPAPASPDQS